YEISNFGKPGYFSKNNSSYWLGKKYIGLGPSAHSYDGVSRSWNVANNSLYLKEIASGFREFETEELSRNDRYNEYIMTGLRTIWGVSLNRITIDFGTDYKNRLLGDASRMIASGLLELKNDVISTTPKGKFLADGIASELFITD
ncbi:MAG: coproporphyrinogen III oxidase, partial [Chitinophagaceae bacterium]